MDSLNQASTPFQPRHPGHAGELVLISWSKKTFLIHSSALSCRHTLSSSSVVGESPTSAYRGNGPRCSIPSCMAVETLVFYSVLRMWTQWRKQKNAREEDYWPVFTATCYSTVLSVASSAPCHRHHSSRREGNPSATPIMHHPAKMVKDLRSSGGSLSPSL